MKDILLKYIENSPYSLEKEWQDMNCEEILAVLGAVADSSEVSQDHSYKIVEIHSYEEALAYKEEAGEWCIIASEDAFDVHTENGCNRFYFCVRDDIKQWPQMAFGKSYPYDNYGLSMIAVCVNSKGELVSVTSRWNWEEDIDNYLDKKHLEELLKVRFKDVFIPASRKSMKILHISDTHGFHPQLTNLPDADVIVHSGDFTFSGSEEEVFDFVNWFCDLPYRHKVFVAGNHDDCLYGCKDFEGLDDNCHYLDGSFVVIDGVKFFGIPMFVQDYVSDGLGTMIESIPDDTEVLVTHCPPLGILDDTDENYFGDARLLEKIKEIKPKLHLFGHIHDKNGVVERGGTTYSNACFVDEHYKAINQPWRLFEI